jgi:hypothetical protein
MPWYVGLIFVAVGLLFVFKMQWFYDFFGPLDFAERYVGGTRFFIKLLGVVCIFIAFLGWTGLLDAMFRGIFSPVLGNI